MRNKTVKMEKTIYNNGKIAFTMVKDVVETDFLYQEKSI